MAVQTEPQTITFLSPRYPTQHLVRVPRYTTLDTFGRQKLVQAGVSYDFEDGQLTLRAGQDLLPDGPDGAERDAIEWLRAHRDYGTQILEVVEELPRPADFLKAVNSAVITLDDVSLRELIAEEEQGYKREDLLSAGRNALGMVEEAQAARSEFEDGDGPASGDPDGS